MREVTDLNLTNTRVQLLRISFSSRYGPLLDVLTTWRHYQSRTFAVLAAVAAAAAAAAAYNESRRS